MRQPALLLSFDEQRDRFGGRQESHPGPGTVRPAPKSGKSTSGRTMSLNMLVYRVTEKKDSASPGETGDPFEAFNVSAAKRIATRQQKVKGTVLVLETWMVGGRAWSQRKTRTGYGPTPPRPSPRSAKALFIIV